MYLYIQVRTQFHLPIMFPNKQEVSFKPQTIKRKIKITQFFFPKYMQLVEISKQKWK